MKRLVLNIITTMTLAMLPVAALPATTFAAPASCPDASSSKGQVYKGIDKTGSDCDDSGVMGTVKAAVNILSLIVGIAAVIMLLIAGFKYITSGGESQRVANAKSTLIYALVGIAVAGAAQALIQFAIKAGVHNSSPPAGGSGGTHSTH